MKLVMTPVAKPYGIHTDSIHMRLRDSNMDSNNMQLYQNVHRWISDDTTLSTVRFDKLGTVTLPYFQGGQVITPAPR